MAGLALALLVVLVLPSAQIELGAKTLQGLVGTYTDPPGGDHWDITYSYQGSVYTAYTGADGTQWNTDTPWTDASSLNAQATVPGDGAVTQTNSGTVTATLTWVSPAGNPPPPSIKVLKSAGGGWYTQNAYGSPAHGNGSDGMGDPYADNGDGSGGSSFGGYNSNSGGTNAGIIPYLVTKDSSGGVVVVDDTLSANFTDAPVQGYSSGTYFTNIGFTATVQPQPYNFRQIKEPDIDNINGSLHFYWAWSSTTGNLSDLSTCTVYEYITWSGDGTSDTTVDGRSAWVPLHPPVGPNPQGGLYAYASPVIQPDPTLPANIGNATKGTADDLFSAPAFVSPCTGPAATWTGHQTYYFDDSATQETKVVIPTTNPKWVSDDIVRSVTKRSTHTWKYTVTTRGYTATISPLP